MGILRLGLGLGLGRETARAAFDEAVFALHCSSHIVTSRAY